MQTRFFVARDGKQMGPWTMSQILLSVQSRQLAPGDYLYDEAIGDWVALMAHPALADALKSVRPEVAAAAVAHAGKGPPDALGAVAWYVLKDENRFGPFAHAELVNMLQAKTLFEYDFVWRPGLAEWARVAAVAEFQPDAIRGLWESKGAMPAAAEIFFRRRHARVAFGASLLLHDNEHVIRARTLEISAGGAAVEIEGRELAIGQTIFLHFKPGDGVPSFNAACKVVNKYAQKSAQSRAGGGKESGAKYGVSFTSIHPSTRDYLEDFANRKLKAA